MKTSNPYRIFIIDDQPVFVAGLTVIIEKSGDMKVCGSAPSWDKIPPDLKANPPNLFIVEIFLQNSDGFQLLRLLRKNFPASAILVYSVQDEVICGERALQSGAKGYLMKSDNLEIIHQAIERLAEGQLFLSRRLQDLIFNHGNRHDATSNRSLLKTLTNRELQIIQFIGQGRSTMEIAAATQLRVKTVEAHRARIKKKLKLKHTTELIRYAVHVVGFGNSYTEARSS